MTDIVIVNGARTAMGGFQGALSSATAPELGAIQLKKQFHALAINDVEEVITSCVLPAGLKQVQRVKQCVNWLTRFNRCCDN